MVLTRRTRTRTKKGLVPACTDTSDAGGEAAGLAAHGAGAAAPGSCAVPRVHDRRQVRRCARAHHNALEL